MNSADAIDCGSPSSSVEAHNVVSVNAHTKQGIRDALGVMRNEAEQRGLEGAERESFYAESIRWMEANVRSLLPGSKYTDRFLHICSFISGGYARRFNPTNKGIIGSMAINGKDGSLVLPSPSLRTLQAVKSAVFGVGALMEIPWTHATATHGATIVNPYRIDQYRTSGDVRLAECNSWTDVVALLATDEDPAPGSIGALLLQRYADQARSQSFPAPQPQPPVKLVEEPVKAPPAKSAQKPPKKTSAPDERLTAASQAFSDAQDGEPQKWSRAMNERMLSLLKEHGVEDTLNAIKWMHRHWDVYGSWTHGAAPNPALLAHMQTRIFDDMRNDRAPSNVVRFDASRRSRVQRSEWSEASDHKAASPSDWGLD